MISITCHIVLKMDGRKYMHGTIDLHMNKLNKLNKYIHLKMMW